MLIIIRCVLTAQLLRGLELIKVNYKAFREYWAIGILPVKADVIKQNFKLFMCVRHNAVVLRVISINKGSSQMLAVSFTIGYSAHKQYHGQQYSQAHERRTYYILLIFC